MEKSTTYSNGGEHETNHNAGHGTSHFLMRLVPGPSWKKRQLAQSAPIPLSMAVLSEVGGSSGQRYSENNILRGRGKNNQSLAPEE